jgi:anti-sigma28 factor (negative regulator of flagellin synthesis)
MNEIPPIHGSMRWGGLTPPGRPAGSSPESAASADRVEFSDTARALSAIQLDSDIRVEKVAEAREAIARGTYLTAGKIEIAVDRLIEALVARP